MQTIPKMKWQPILVPDKHWRKGYYLMRTCGTNTSWWGRTPVCSTLKKIYLMSSRYCACTSVGLFYISKAVRKGKSRRSLWMNRLIKSLTTFPGFSFGAQPVFDIHRARDTNVSASFRKRVALTIKLLTYLHNMLSGFLFPDCAESVLNYCYIKRAFRA